jgi:hypothetical protein
MSLWKRKDTFLHRKMKAEMPLQKGGRVSCVYRWRDGELCLLEEGE